VKYQYYFNYGVLVLAGYNEDEMKWAVKAISAFQKNPLTPWLRDDHELTVEEGSSIAFQFDEVILDRIDEHVIRVAMLNLAQSVALD
jgi:required for meiotic nuclear division protein 1